MGDWVNQLWAQISVLLWDGLSPSFKLDSIYAICFISICNTNTAGQVTSWTYTKKRVSIEMKTFRISVSQMCVCVLWVSYKWIHENNKTWIKILSVYAVYCAEIFTHIRHVLSSASNKYSCCYFYLFVFQFTLGWETKFILCCM